MSLTESLRSEPPMDPRPTEREGNRTPATYCWQYFLLKGIGLVYILGCLLLVWPLFSLWLSPWFQSNEKGLKTYNHDHNPRYFDSFHGYAECRVSLPDIYDVPTLADDQTATPEQFCNERSLLLEAISGGGRIGVDAPFKPRGCAYRWIEPGEICTILERFENIIFTGDALSHTIFAGLNILLRKDLLTGGLSNVTADEIASCKCDNQFLRSECADKMVDSSKEMDEDDPEAEPKHSFICSKPNVHFLRLDAYSSSTEWHNSMRSLLPIGKKTHKPIPVIHSAAYGTNPPLSISKAIRSLSDLVELASLSNRTPILGIGPSASTGTTTTADLVQDADQKIQYDPELSAWEFSILMRQAAAERDVEWLGMWNMTAQATSVTNDPTRGPMFGMDVAIIQAMAVVNWLSRLESS